MALTDDHPLDQEAKVIAIPNFVGGPVRLNEFEAREERCSLVSLLKAMALADPFDQPNRKDDDINFVFVEPCIQGTRNRAFQGPTIPNLKCFTCILNDDTGDLLNLVGGDPGRLTAIGQGVLPSSGTALIGALFARPHYRGREDEALRHMLTEQHRRRK